jgi:hypothetical protein
MRLRRQPIDKRLDFTEALSYWGTGITTTDTGDVICQIRCLCLVEHGVTPRNYVSQ